MIISPNSQLGQIWKLHFGTFQTYEYAAFGYNFAIKVIFNLNLHNKQILCGFSIFRPNSVNFWEFPHKGYDRVNLFHKKGIIANFIHWKAFSRSGKKIWRLKGAIEISFSLLVWLNCCLISCDPVWRAILLRWKYSEMSLKFLWLIAFMNNV